jgi:CxxC-x17-CxxC domain-containing protein
MGSWPAPAGRVFALAGRRSECEEHRFHGEEANLVTYVDRTLTCADCGVEFIHSAADQEFYAQKGFASDPKRCPSCRASRRATRETSGFDVREIGGPRGYERGYDRPMREYFAVICSKCGNAAQVPFKPRMDKPVYCSDCFRTVQAS